MNQTTSNFRNWVETQSQSDTSFVLSPELRNTSLTAIRSQNFPTRKDEEWRYTPLKAIAESSPVALVDTQISPQQIEPFAKAVPGAHLLVFVDGKFSSALSDDLSSQDKLGLNIRLMEDLDSESRKQAEGIIVHSKLTDDNIFRHITNSLATSGLFIDLKPNADIEVPLHLLFVNTKQTSTSVTHPMNIIHLGQNSRLDIVQQFASLGDLQSLSFPADYIQLDDGSKLGLYKVGLESEETDHISNCAVQVANSASFEDHQYLLGSKLTRSNLEVNLSGNGAEVFLRGIYLGDKSQHLDIRTYIDHAQAYCSSDQHFRGILNGKSRGVFNGMVLVREHAQKTNAQQSNKNLLLSRDARVDTKPQLEIFADDVKCTHGATIGELDDNALFYLQSRGISRQDAAQMLTRAFAAEITDEIKIDTLKEYIQQEIESRLTETHKLNA